MLKWRPRCQILITQFIFVPPRNMIKIGTICVYRYRSVDAIKSPEDVMSPLNSQLESVPERDILSFISRLIVYHFRERRSKENGGKI